MYAFFAMEMVLKMVAMGIWRKNGYLKDNWNKLDFLIVIAGLVKCCVMNQKEQIRVQIKNILVKVTILHSDAPYFTLREREIGNLSKNLQNR